MKRIFALLVLLTSCVGFAQSINDYKYIIVPQQFGFVKGKNEYNLSLLTKMMFEKYGFTTFIEGDKLPDELALDRCKPMYADLIKSNSFLTTNIVIALKDCQGKTLYTSETGKSKEKEFKKAYQEALRDASHSLDNLNYQYTSNAVVQSKAASNSSQAASSSSDDVLFAEPMPNGYKLVDRSLKEVLKIYKTSKADSYSAQSDTKNGVVFKQGNDWYFEYYKDDKMVSEKLNIKF
jgi:hypothetical protein